jgi:hypothetical protein
MSGGQGALNPCRQQHANQRGAAREGLMASVRIKVPGDAGGTRTAQMHHAVADHWRRAMEAKDRVNKPKKPAQVRRTFAHIRDFREVMK